MVLLKTVLLNLVRMKEVMLALLTIFKDSGLLEPMKLPSEDLGIVMSYEVLMGGAGAKLAFGVRIIGLFELLLLELVGALDMM